jgi:predicted phage tail protein
MTTGAPDERHLDREQAISALKAAFVQGRLTSDEFDVRVGQALTSRTRAELAAITADIPAGPIGVRPAQPALEVKSGVCVTASAALLAAALWAAAWSAGSAAAGAAALAVSGVVIFTLFVTVYQLRAPRRLGHSGRPLPPGTAG